MIYKKHKNLCTGAFLKLLIFGLMLSVLAVQASDCEQYVIIGGQVLNKEHGNPIDEHPVFVTSEISGYDRASIFLELRTNEEGYFYDTIFTQNNNGALKVFTFDYLDQEIDTIVHFRFMNVCSNTLLANFEILMPFQLEQLQARFTQYQISPSDRFKYQFIDQTQNEHIISWQWNFGDGSISTQQNPSHTFTEPGLYKILLTVRSQQFGVVETSVTTQQIYISDLAYYHMGGHTFAHQFPIDEGLAFLYLADSSKRPMIPIDTCAFDTLGYYYFYQVPEGEYIVKAQPSKSSQYYSEMLPTYYGDQIFWQQAELIDHDITHWEYDINLTEGQGIVAGLGSISGRVLYQGHNRDGDSIPAEGVDIYLFNLQNEKLLSHYSDENGEFRFTSLEAGSYWVYPEVTGQQSDMLNVQISESNPNIDNIHIIIMPTDVNLSIPEPVMVSDLLVNALYPNPANDHINFDFKSEHKQQLLLETYDLMGRKVNQMGIMAVSGPNSIQLDTDQLNNGIYILRLVVNGQLNEQRFVVSH